MACCSTTIQHAKKKSVKKSQGKQARDSLRPELLSFSTIQILEIGHWFVSKFSINSIPSKDSQKSQA